MIQYLRRKDIMYTKVPINPAPPTPSFGSALSLSLSLSFTLTHTYIFNISAFLLIRSHFLSGILPVFASFSFCSVISFGHFLPMGGGGACLGLNAAHHMRPIITFSRLKCVKLQATTTATSRLTTVNVNKCNNRCCSSSTTSTNAYCCCVCEGFYTMCQNDNSTRVQVPAV